MLRAVKILHSPKAVKFCSPRAVKIKISYLKRFIRLLLAMVESPVSFSNVESLVSPPVHY